MSSVSPERRRPLDPDVEEMRRLAHETVDRLVDHLAELRDKQVARRGRAADFAALVDEALPADGRGIQDSLDFFFSRIAPRMTHVNHPRFHAYIPCPGSFAGTVGEWLAAGTNPFLGSWLGGATLSSLELTVLRWIAELIGYPTNASGILTSGGSTANLAALASARVRHAPDPAAARIYVSAEGHASMDKAARILGFPDSALAAVAVDERGRMRPDDLRRQVEADRVAGRAPFFVCANAGTTNTGAVDPLPDLHAVCAAEGLWFHVDGAYGGFAAVAERGRKLLPGLDLADSVTLDPHKWLWTPMGVGCVLVRRRQELAEAFAGHGAYLQDLPEDEINFLDQGPELSRPARVLSAWMVIRATGREELARQVEDDLDLARYVARELAADERFELVDEPQLSIVAFRHRARPGESEEGRAARDRDLMERTLEDGRCMLSTTVTGGRTALRLVVMNHRTTRADLDITLQAVREFAT